MNWTIWLLRMSRWARHPPSRRRVMMVLGILALCLTIAGIEALGFWPDSLTLDKPHRVPPIPK